MHRSLTCILLICILSSAEEATTTYGSGSMPLLTFYQKVLSPLRVGKRCPMWPSCSQYAKLQLSSTNPFAAYAHVCDRLVRCGRDPHTYADTTFHFRKSLIDNPFSPTAPFTLLPVKVVRRENRHDHSEGDFLYKNRFYDLAFESYLSSLSNGRNDATILKAAHAAYYSEPAEKYAEILFNLSKLSTHTQLDGELTLLLAKRYFEAKQFSHSLRTLSSFDTLYTTETHRGEAQLLKELNTLYHSGTGKEHTPLENAILQSELNEIYTTLPTLPYRNRNVAGLLSVFVPGSGYLMGKRKRSALFSFVTSGVTIASTVELYRKEKPVTASLMALVASGFYVGSITGARRSVDAYNTQLRYKTLDTILSEVEVGPAR